MLMTLIQTKMENFVRSLKISLIVSVLILKVFEISSEFTTALGKRRANFDDKTNAFRQIWNVTANSACGCTTQCNKDVRCASVFFNKNSRQCRGHSVTLSEQESTRFEDDSRYYVMAFGEHYIGDSCFTSNDCWTPYAECRQGMCMCIPGYSFSPSTHECMVCSYYGDQFMEVQNQWISGYNKESFQQKMLDECAQLCLTRTGYFCVTFEYNRTSGFCVLQDKTRFDVSSNYWYVETGDTYKGSQFQRDCA